MSKGYMDLSNVTTGPLSLPWAIILYGVEGVGKTTFGADAEKPIILGPEMGTARMAHVARAPRPRNWGDVFEFLQQLIIREHPFKTLVVDSLDWLEPLIFEAVCQNARVNSIEKVEGGYGKGYTFAVDEWRFFLHKLDELRSAKRMQIILIAHAQIRKAPNPDGPDLDRYALAFNQKAADLVKQWADFLLFARFKTATAEIDDRIKGLNTPARRVIHTEHRATFDAKNRVNLPPEIPLDYAEFLRLVEAGVSADETRGKLEALLPRLDAATQAKARDWIAAVGNDGTKLAQILNRVLNRISAVAENGSKEAAA